MTTEKSEIKKFTDIAEKWWDEKGPFKLLHEINPVRLEYVLEQICNFYSLKSNQDIKDLKILDIGCGGGILSIPLSRLKAKVTGIDAGKENIDIAKSKAETEKLDAKFECCQVQDFVEKHPNYDVVICLEVLEHVDNPKVFISYLAKAVKPGGLVITSTINRTLKSRLLAIGMAEYILKMVPRGTHEYNKLITPAEIKRYGEACDLELIGLSGMVFNLMSQEWVLSENIDINYFASFKKN